MEDVLAVYARPTIPHARWCAWTRSPTSCWPMLATRSQQPRDATGERIRSTSARDLLDLLLGRAPGRLAACRCPAPAHQGRLGRTGQRLTVRGLPRRGDGGAGDGQPHTHGIGSLYEAFEPAEAFALAQRLEIHHTPKHGSWLNVAEIELSVLTRQCLDRRIENLESLNAELAAWQRRTNADQRQVQWHFTTDDARIKLRHLYPNT